MLDCPPDARLRAFAENRLPPEDRDALAAHARTCQRCQSRMSAIADALSGAVSATAAFAGPAQVRPREAAPQEPEPPPLERGTSIGRYTILALVGQGGMGEVYAAYDPELDRKIALKLLRARGSADSRSQARLLREAKSIAKLSHANVVVVHDAGTFHDRVFVAMEFIDGLTAKDWLGEARRSRREILDIFSAAARGLAAAHAAGLVHRDFKPHNVMVGRDGGVRVMDFGLAREIEPTQDPGGRGAADGAPAAPAATAMPAEIAAAFTGGVTGASWSTRELHTALTRTGELVGTPLYMAPEQFQAARTDARTDQFSFCVALYQALYGAHPFGGETLQALVTRVLTGEIQPPPAKHEVPTWLRRVLLRGLSVQPAARWASMAELIGALESDPARKRRRWATTAGVGLLVAAAVVTVVRGSGRAESLCRGGPARLAGIWEAPGAPARPRRDALAGAFVKVGGTRATETWTRVEALLDRYAGAWLAMYRDACEATHARGEQSGQTLDLRMTCLDERRTALSALTNVLASPDDVAISKAVDAANALPPLERCADLKLLRAPVEPPRDEATRARVDALRKRAAVVKAMGDTGRFDQAIADAGALVAEARPVGYRPFLAESLILHGELQDRVHDYAAATKNLEEGVWAALGSHVDELAAEGGALLVGDVGYMLARHDEGWRWARLTRAILDRMGEGHERTYGWLLVGEASIKLQEHDLQGALTLQERGLALKEKVLPPDHPDIAMSLNNVGNTLLSLGRNEEALRALERTIQIIERAYGSNSRQLAQYWSNKGEVLLALGRAKEAEPAFRDALTRWESEVGPRHTNLGFPLTGLGLTLTALGRAPEALDPLRRAVSVREGDGVDANDLADSRFALARALRAAGRDEGEARALAAKARAVLAPATDEPSRKRVREIDAWLAAKR